MGNLNIKTKVKLIPGDNSVQLAVDGDIKGEFSSIQKAKEYFFVNIPIFLSNVNVFLMVKDQTMYCGSEDLKDFADELDDWENWIDNLLEDFNIEVTFKGYKIEGPMWDLEGTVKNLLKFMHEYTQYFDLEAQGDYFYEESKELSQWLNSTFSVVGFFRNRLREGINSQSHNITLDYKNLDLVLRGEYHQPTWGYYGGSPGYYDDIEVTKDFEYEVDADDVVEALWETIMADEDSEDALEYKLQHKSEDDVIEYIEEHFDELVKKYHSDLLNIFKDNAIEAAEEYYQNEYDNWEPDPDMYDDGPDY